MKSLINLIKYLGETHDVRISQKLEVVVGEDTGSIEELGYSASSSLENKNKRRRKSKTD